MSTRTMAVFLGLSALLSSTPIFGQLLFSDTFNRPNSTNISASSTGMSGLLAPLTYFQTSGVDITNQVLRAGGQDTASVVPLHNFTDPAIGTARGFQASFDIVPPDTTDFAGNADWGAFGIGYALPDAEAGGIVIGGNKAFGFLVRGSGGNINQGQIALGANGFTSLGDVTFDTTPTPNEAYHVNVLVTADTGQILFVAGQTATARIDITGQLDAAPGNDLFTVSRSFSWIGSNNYVVLEGSDPVSINTFDNFTISVVPEPTFLALVGIGCVALLRRRVAFKRRDNDSPEH